MALGSFTSIVNNFIEQLDNPESSTQANFESIQEFIIGCNGEDVRSQAGPFASLCHKLSQTLIQRRQTILGIDLLSRAITKIQTHSSQLTSVHADLCQLCLDAKCFRPALDFLDVDITDINKENGVFDVEHFLLYYHYGGMIYAAVKNFERALYFFEAVLTTPATHISNIVVEAYKKHLILTLLLHCKLPETVLPKYTSQCVSRYRRQLGPAYLKLASEYPSLKYEKVRRIVQLHNRAYERDDNVGLIKQCLAALHKRNIQRLTKTFLTLSLKDVSQHVGLSGEKEAESYILQMIEDGEIFATINQRDGMVVFHDNPEKFDNAIIFKKLEEDIENCTALCSKLREMDLEIANNPKYISKMRPEE